VTLATAYILMPGTINPICAIQSFTVYKPGSTTAIPLFSMSISFFRSLELDVGALLLVVVVVVGVVLVWMWFSGLGKAASSAELAPDVLKIEGGNVTNLGGGVRVFLWIRNLGGGAVLPRTVYVYKSGDVVCFADGLPWVVGPGRLEYLDVWMPVGPPSDVGGGVVAGCREAVVSGAVYVVELATARGAEASVVVTV